MQAYNLARQIGDTESRYSERVVGRNWVEGIEVDMKGKELGEVIVTRTRQHCDNGPSSVLPNTMSSLMISGSA
jgi:hypothetical protein